MKQKEVVFNAITDVTGEDNFESEVELTKEQRSDIHEIVLKSLVDGEMDFSDSARKNYDTPAKTSGYVSGLISNWLRKDPRLNGDTKYQPKNPGSRAGQGDPQIKALRQLKRIHVGTEKEAEIQGYIETRLTKIASEKVKNVDIDYSQLPTELRDLAPSNEVAESNEDAA